MDFALQTIELSERYKWLLQLQNTYRDVLHLKIEMDDVSKLLYAIHSDGARVRIYVQN
jgi:hypothetical protein